MDDAFSLPKLLARRKLTRAMADLLRTQAQEYLTTLAPLFRPRNVIGEYGAGGTKDGRKGPEQALRALQEVFGKIAPAKPFNLPSELTLPLELGNSVLELHPFEYNYQASDAGQSKSVVITSPLKWLLVYAGFPPKRLKELIQAPNGDPTELRSFVLHTLVLHVVITRQPGLPPLLQDLHFRLVSETHPDFGPLPMTYLAAEVVTARPSDDIVIAGTELSGRDVFEEVVDPRGLSQLRDRLKDRLSDLAQAHEEATRA